MTNTNDTIDGLLAEFRGYSAGMPPSYHVTMSWADFRKMLDRLEAAHKRESGNAAKLREAVGDLLYMAERYVKKTPATESVIFDAKTKKEIRTVNYYDVIAKAQAALAAPPRNCDVGTAEEQARRHLKYCVKQDCEKACPFRDCKNSYECAFAWAQMPYEESGIHEHNEQSLTNNN